MKHSVLNDVPYLREAITIKTRQHGNISPDQLRFIFGLTSAFGVQERLMKRASFPKLRASTHISSPSNLE